MVWEYGTGATGETYADDGTASESDGEYSATTTETETDTTYDYGTGAGGETYAENGTGSESDGWASGTSDDDNAGQPETDPDPAPSPDPPDEDDQTIAQGQLAERLEEQTGLTVEQAGGILALFLIGGYVAGGDS